jgi:hypothetical protein
MVTALVQSNINAASLSAGAVTGTCAFTSNVSKGDSIIVPIFLSAGAGSAITSMTDTLGNNYTSVLALSGGEGLEQFWWCPASKSGGANTVTIHFTIVTSGFFEAIVLEVSGGCTQSDQTSTTNNATSATLTTPAKTPKYNTEFAVAYFLSTNPSSAGSGWSTAQNDGGGGLVIYKNLTNAAGTSVQATASQSPSSTYDGIFATFAVVEGGDPIFYGTNA